MNHLKARVNYGTKIEPKKGNRIWTQTRTKIERSKATNRPKFQKLRPQESAKQSSLPIKTLGNKTDQKPLSTTLPVQASLDLKVLNGQQRLLWKQSTSKKISLQNICATSGTIARPCHTSHLGHKQTKTNFRSQVHQGVLVILVAQLVSRHSCVADRLPVVVRFPAGPRVRLKTINPPKGNGLEQKKQVHQGVLLRIWQRLAGTEAQLEKLNLIFPSTQQFGVEPFQFELPYKNFWSWRLLETLIPQGWQTEHLQTIVKHKWTLRTLQLASICGDAGVLHLH